MVVVATGLGVPFVEDSDVLALVGESWRWLEIGGRWHLLVIGVRWDSLVVGVRRSCASELIGGRWVALFGGW